MHRYRLVEGPRESPRLGPLPDGKTHTLVLDSTMLFSFWSRAGCPITRKYARPSREPDAKGKMRAQDGKPATEVEVWYRPGLKDFLADALKHYENVVFSAGSKDYVEWVINTEVDPMKKFISHVFTIEDVSRYELRCNLTCYMHARMKNRTPIYVKDIKGFL